MVALMLLATLGALAFTAASLILLESRQQEAVRRAEMLRSAAVGAAQRGLAELQASMGPDTKHDYASSGALMAAGKTTASPLTGEAAQGSVYSRWDVADLSMGHDVSACSEGVLRASAWATSNVGRARLPRALASSVSPAQAVALAVGGPDFYEPRQGPGLSWQVRGLLTDPVRGGWKRDLSAEAGLIAELDQPLASTLRGAGFGQSPAKGVPPVRMAQESGLLDTLPVLANLRLSLGFFNARSDGRHRLRFHGSAVFWNRLSVPVLGGPQGKMFLVEFVGSPEGLVSAGSAW